MRIYLILEEDLLVAKSHTTAMNSDPTHFNRSPGWIPFSTVHMFIVLLFSLWTPSPRLVSLVTARSRLGCGVLMTACIMVLRALRAPSSKRSRPNRANFWSRFRVSVLLPSRRTDYWSEKFAHDVSHFQSGPFPAKVTLRFWGRPQNYLVEKMEKAILPKGTSFGFWWHWKKYIKPNTFS